MGQDKSDDAGRHSLEEVDKVDVPTLHELPPSLAALSPAEYKRVGRMALLKLDITIFPCLMMIYVLNYLDRQNIASAKLANLEEDLNLKSTQYQTCVSILFVGYIIMQVPSNMMLGKIKWPAVYICGSMALWGVVAATQAAAQNFAGLLVTRFFIGFVEAVFFPGALFYLSLFYNRKQYAFRAALFYAGSQLGNAFGSLLAIGLLTLDGRYGLEGWRWLFLIEGVLTIGLALIFAVVLPNSPRHVRGLSAMEHEWIRWNYEQDQGQQDNRDEITARQGFILAVRDPKTWLLMATLYMCYVAAAVVNFFPSVVATLGYSRTMTYVLTAPPFLLCCFTMSANGFHSDRVGERFMHVAGPMFIALAANIIAVSTLNTGARYTAMMLMPGSVYASSIVILSWLTGNLSQPVAKRSAAIALVNAVCNTPNIWTSYLYFGAPRYTVAFVVNIVTAGLTIVFAVLTRIYLLRENAKLDRGQDVGKSGPTEAQISNGFRYTL